MGGDRCQGMQASWRGKAPRVQAWEGTSGGGQLADRQVAGRCRPHMEDSRGDKYQKRERARGYRHYAAEEGRGGTDTGGRQEKRGATVRGGRWLGAT